MPELEGNLLFQHESRGHWPYDRGCEQARGRAPARCRTVAEPCAPSAAPPSAAVPADDRMDVDLRGDDDDFPIKELGCIEDHCIHWIIKVFGMSLHLLKAAWK